MTATIFLGGILMPARFRFAPLIEALRPAAGLAWGNRLQAGRGDAVQRSSGLFGPVEVRRVRHTCSTPASQGVHVLTI
jgi:hypothetical protein